MSEPAEGPPTACSQCLRRSWLLAQLSATLDFHASDRCRLNALLALDDQELIDALGGRRKEELRTWHEAFTCAHSRDSDASHTVCRHCNDYPLAMSDDAGAPWMLHAAGGGERLTSLTHEPVAIVGSRRASDYGAAMAHALARGLAASGVTVMSAFRDGIAAAALEGANAGGGGALAVVGGGLGVSCPARHRGLYMQLMRSGCVISELPHDCRGRRWGAAASERIIARLASVVVVVEAEHKPPELVLAHTARSLGQTIAAVPGRVTSPLCGGTHALLMEGASLVRNAADVLELLHPLEAAPSLRRTAAVSDATHAQLEPRLADVLARVGSGYDTPEKLTDARLDLQDALCALSELELMGLLGRGDGGRYVSRTPSV